jgi:hypothetical protein
MRKPTAAAYARKIENALNANAHAGYTNKSAISQ